VYAFLSGDPHHDGADGRILVLRVFSSKYLIRGRLRAHDAGILAGCTRFCTHISHYQLILYTWRNDDVSSWFMERVGLWGQERRSRVSHSGAKRVQAEAPSSAVSARWYFRGLHSQAWRRVVVPSGHPRIVADRLSLFSPVQIANSPIFDYH